MSVPAVDGVYPDVDEAVYHADHSSLSVSGAKLLLPPSCPAKFREAQDNPPKPKREYDFGHLAHRLILGKGADIAVVDAPDWRTKAAREARDQAHAEGRIPALASELEAAERMRDAVMAHPVAGTLFVAGQAEVSLYRTDSDTGVRLRGRCDWIADDGDLVDFKTSTTANPAELMRKFWQFGYHMQGEWYRSLAIAAGLSDDPDFLFVCAEKDAPHVVTVVRYDQESLDEGARLNRLAINTYAECTASGVWPGYSDEIATISLPGWAVHETRAAADQQDADAIIAELEGIYQ